MLQEIFTKYIRKSSVQHGVISQVTKTIITRLLRIENDIQCKYRNEFIFISKISHEHKIELYLKKNLIISLSQKKLLEDFGINAIIKDIRIQ